MKCTRRQFLVRSGRMWLCGSTQSAYCCVPILADHHAHDDVLYIVLAYRHHKLRRAHHSHEEPAAVFLCRAHHRAAGRTTTTTTTCPWLNIDWLGVVLGSAGVLSLSLFLSPSLSPPCSCLLPLVASAFGFSLDSFLRPPVRPMPHR